MAFLLCIAVGLVSLLAFFFLFFVTVYSLARLVGWATGWWKEEQSRGIAEGAMEVVGEILRLAGEFIGLIADAIGCVASLF